MLAYLAYMDETFAQMAVVADAQRIKLGGNNDQQELITSEAMSIRPGTYTRLSHHL